MKKLILGVISDLCSDFLYYDRKKSNTLPIEALNNAVKYGAITIDEMVAEFRKHLEGTFNGMTNYDSVMNHLNRESGIVVDSNGVEMHTLKSFTKHPTNPYTGLPVKSIIIDPDTATANAVFDPTPKIPRWEMLEHKVPMSCYVPTINLRFVERNERFILQQLWEDLFYKTTQWRDIPVEKE